MDVTATISVESPADFDEQLGAEITLLAGQINAANPGSPPLKPKNPC